MQAERRPIASATVSERSHFDVLVLGPCALYRDGAAVDVGGWQRKVQILFRMLATTPDHRRSRDEVADILWPESTSDAGARNLRVVLHMLRRGLGSGEPSPVISEWGWIAFNPAHEWDIDLNRFERLTSQAGDDIVLLEEAAGFYRGEPLVEDRYEDWALPIRTRVQRTWRDLCLRLARRHREAGAADIAVRWLDRLMDTDPLDEEALRVLIGVLGALGRRTDALRRYAQFAERLKAEMDLTPAQETVETVEALKQHTERPDAAGFQGGVSPARPVPVTPHYPLLRPGPLAGRKEELGRILWSLPPSAIEAPRLLAIRGDTGIGKTRLLAEVASRARDAGLLTLAGSCYASEMLPFGPLHDALIDYLETQPEVVARSKVEGLAGDIGRVLPELRLRYPDLPEQRSDDTRLRLFVAVSALLERIAADMPLVLLIDDLHWADESTLGLVHYVARRPRLLRVLIVVAFRCDATGVTGWLQEMEKAGWAASVPLGAMSPEELGRMLEERIRGRCSDELVGGIYAASRGNPAIALAVLRSLHDNAALRTSEEGWALLPGASIELPLTDASV